MRWFLYDTNHRYAIKETVNYTSSRNTTSQYKICSSHQLSLEAKVKHNIAPAHTKLVRMVESKFKVIVVGGGPVGLTAAHALSRAGIDYVVLEQRQSVELDVGASLVLWPQGLRVLAQLDLFERLQNIGADLRHMVTVNMDGYKYKDSWVSGAMKTK